MNRRRITIIGVGLLLLLLSFLLLRTEFAPEAEPDVLLVLSAPELQYPMEDIAGAFMRRTGVPVQLVFDAPEALLEHIQSERRGDLLLPGSLEALGEAEAAGLVTESATVAWYVPALLVQFDNPSNVQGLQDLARPGLRVGLAREDVPGMGAATRMLLQKNDLSAEGVAENTALAAATVQELSQGVFMRLVDVAVVPRPVARLNEERADSVAIPREDNIAVPLPLARLNTSRQQAEAQEFADFLHASVAQDIFRRHGYETAEE